MSALKHRRQTDPQALDALDRRIVVATQNGLPLCKRPFEAVASQVGLTETEVMDRLSAMVAKGIIRRIAAVPNHYKLGYRANGMSVWDVDDALLPELGRQVGALPFVSHAYHRPRRLSIWPYNLFAMVHGQAREDVLEKVNRIGHLLGDACRQSDVLFSTRILKKTGLRLTG